MTNFVNIKELNTLPINQVYNIAKILIKDIARFSNLPVSKGWSFDMNEILQFSISRFLRVSQLKTQRINDQVNINIRAIVVKNNGQTDPVIFILDDKGINELNIHPIYKLNLLMQILNLFIKQVHDIVEESTQNRNRYALDLVTNIGLDIRGITTSLGGSLRQLTSRPEEIEPEFVSIGFDITNK